MIKNYTMLIALCVPMYTVAADGAKDSADSSYWSYLGWGSASTTDKRVQNWIKQTQEAIDQSLAKALEDAKEKMQDASEKILDNAIEQLDEQVLQQEGPVDQAVDRTRDKLQNTVGKILDNAIEQLDTKVLQQEGPIDQAIHRVVEDARRQLEDTAEKVIDKAKDDLKEMAQHVLVNDVRPLGQELIIHAAQNVGKMALSSTMGLFGAVTAYKGLIHTLEAKRQAYQTYAQLHNQQAADEKNSHHDSNAYFLSAKIKKLGSFSTDEAQQIGAVMAGAGITSFAVACMLCCYWIR